MTQVTRRQFVLGAGVSSLGLLAGCGRLPWQATPPPRVPRLGILYQSGPDIPDAIMEGLQAGLREHGLIEGQNVAVEYRYAHGNFERLPELAAELVQAQVDVLVAAGGIAAHAAKGATTTIPVVMMAPDPVGNGLVASLARPGGNVTGVSIDTGRGLPGKRLELLKAVTPGLSHVAALWNPDETGLDVSMAEILDATQVLGLTVHDVPVRGAHELDNAFEAIVRERAEAITLAGATMHRNSARIAELALQARLPTIQPRSEFAHAGGLMTYGPSWYHVSRRMASYVQKILNGTSPADLPVEQPMTFEFVVNMKTAQALGITFPNEIVLQVTEAIQ